jgi:prevent-host-death family protein
MAHRSKRQASAGVTRTVNIHEARTQLSKLIEAVGRGEEVIIARNGEPVARLVPYSTAVRVPGAARGRGRLTRAFFDDLPESVLAAFEGPA